MKKETKKKIGIAISLSVLLIVWFIMPKNHPDQISSPRGATTVVSHAVHEKPAPQKAPSLAGESMDQSEPASKMPVAAKQLNVPNKEPNEIEKLFADSVINEHTLQIAASLQHRFDSTQSDKKSHLDQVESYLRSQLNDDTKTDRFLNFYSDYYDYTRMQAQPPNTLFQETPQTFDDTIDLAYEQHQLKRDYFGDKIADTLWGDEIKGYHYKMRELEILRDDSTDPETKERLIEDLKAGLGAAGSYTYNDRLDTRLYVQLSIHGDELMTMTDAQRKEKIKEIRYRVYANERPPEETDSHQMTE